LFQWREETFSFWLEMALLVIIPVALLTREKIRNNPQSLYWTCCVVVAGFMTNRLNVSVTGLQASAGIYYVPKWTEFACTMAVVTAAVVAFRYAVIYLEILPKNEPKPKWMSSGAAAHA
jgi:Ni/Fe-hydrogenase subunit HybB-like protein